MSQPAKRYASEVRDEQARRTRRTIVTAAHDLFLAQGYAATTIDAIAEAAHVSRRTVFNSAGGKATLLKLALDWAIAGDDEQVPISERPAVKAIQAQRDPRQGVELWVEMVTDIAARVAPIAEVLAAAADTDPDAAQLVADGERDRMHGATAFIQYLASLDALAPGITPQHAADVCWSFMDTHVYYQLVTKRGWTMAEFRTWLSSTLTRTLLDAQDVTEGR
jgi:AcrR family transcriptional regulator